MKVKNLFDRDIEASKTIEALEELKKLPSIPAALLSAYIGKPFFTDEIKKRIFDIVRECEIISGKNDIKRLTTKEYKESIYSYDVETIMKDIYCGSDGDTLYDAFVPKFDEFVLDEITKINTAFAFDDCFANAYVTVVDEIKCELYAEWLNECISLDEWFDFLMSITEG